MHLNANLFKNNCGNVNKCYMFLQKGAVAQLPTKFLFQTSAAFGRKKKSYYCKLCKLCVKQGNPSPEDAHIFIYIYVCVYAYIILEVNSSWQICVASPQENVT